ncbi:MAG TPA: CHAT domain-containing protein, partial [Pyrinomonadaceae bacterium]
SEEKNNLLGNHTEAELKELCALLLKQSRAAANDGNLSKSLELVKLARATAEKINFREGAAESLYLTGLIYGWQNEHSPALEYHRKSLALYESLGNKIGQADVLNTVAYIYRTLADYDAALEYLNRHLKIREELGDRVMIVSLLNQIGAVYMYRGDYNAAEKSHKQGLEICEADKNQAGIADSTFHLAIINRLRGNYGAALRYYQQARQIQEILSRSAPNTYKAALSTVLRHIGGTYFLQGNLRLALDYANKSFAIDEERKDKSAIAYSLQFISLIRFSEKNYAEALSLAERTMPLYEELGDRDGAARSLALLGNIQSALGSYEKSLEYFRRALAIRQNSNSRDGIAITRIGIAKVLLAQGKYREAITLANQAADAVKQSGNREQIWQAQSIAGQAQRALDECDAARISFDAAIATIESLRGEVVGGGNENSLFFAEKVKPYQQMAAMLAEENDFSGAFEYAERAKARVLLDALRSGRSQPPANITDAEKTEENRLRSELVALNAQISRTDASKNSGRQRLAELQNKLEQARTAFQIFQTNLYAAYPELRIRRGGSEPVKLPEIAGLLDEKTALLEYLVTDNAVFLFVLTKQNGEILLKTHRVEINRSELARRTNRFRQMLAESNLLFGAQSRGLYDLLLKPAQAQIKNKSNLVIVPDDGLWELPFQALQAAENHYVLDDAAISYIPSLTIWRELRAAKQSENKLNNLLAFGNPSSATSGDKTNFAALPEAARQALALRGLYGAGNSRIFVGAAATEDVFKREAAKFSVLHLATHGVLDNVSPLNSYVLLAPNAAANEDGRLEAWEILEMNLPAEMVVLSACETARGQARSGEGIIGLAWSLMVAGARTVVVSQWKVESSSTTDLMTEFYKSLRQNSALDKSQALRQSALKLRRSERFAHPFYWAGFIEIGAN